MDELESLKLREWVNEFNDVSSRRIVAHELNNYLTPMAMQVSMLKNNLGSNQLGKAIERIGKLEIALGKLKGFSQDLLIENIFSDDIEYLKSSSEIKNLMDEVLQLPEFKGLELNWSKAKFSGAMRVHPKILTLFVYAFLREQITEEESALCNVKMAEDHDGKIHITLSSQVLVENSASAHHHAKKISSFERLIKIVNSSHSGHRISRLKSDPNSGVLSIEPQSAG